MAVLHCPTVVLGWAWSLCGSPLLTPWCCSAPGMSPPAQGHPVCQLCGESDSDPQRNPPTLRAGWALQAWHRLAPAPAALMMLAARCGSPTEQSCLHLLLGPHSLLRCGPQQSSGCSACCCREVTVPRTGASRA